MTRAEQLQRAAITKSGTVAHIMRYRVPYIALCGVWLEIDDETVGCSKRARALWRRSGCCSRCRKIADSDGILGRG